MSASEPPGGDGRDQQRKVGVRVPASTANLGPGFDAFGAALSRHLDAWVLPAEPGRPKVTSEGEGAGELPDDDENLLWRAFLALCTRAGVPVPDVRVRVLNRIPLERGLGSSSAAIVAGLGLARAACALPVGDHDLVRLATTIEGHPDNVAPAVLGGLVCAARTDEGDLVVRRGQPHPRLRPVALVPSTRQRTTAARAVLPDAVDRDAVVDQAARAGHLLAALLGAWPAAAALAGDRLHEPSRLDTMTATGSVIDDLRSAGIHAWLSGAGPSVCAAVAARDEVALRRCAAVGGRHDFEVWALRWDLAGLVALPS
ncbi:MAG TPA: homoserine kinase [Nitriliruptorales bacterium]|nr:homoserine kinase [Nitriliruptorales bacterium]